MRILSRSYHAAGALGFTRTLMAVLGLISSCIYHKIDKPFYLLGNFRKLRGR